MEILDDGPDFLDSFDAELFGELVETIIVESNERIRFRLKKRAGAVRNHRKDGALMGNRKQPFGYRVVMGEIALHPQESKLVEYIFQQYLCGCYLQHLGRGASRTVNSL